MPKIACICAHCAGEFFLSRSAIVSGRRFCSRQCARTARPLRPVKERFDELWMPEPMSGCWLWLAAVKSQQQPQRGHFDLDDRTIGAHRAAWILYKGEIPNGLSVLHHCDNSLCVNPGHLFLGTQRDNMADMVQKGRSPKGESKWGAKLTTADVNAIRASPDGHTALAHRFGVADSIIVRVRQRLIWRHL
jgi:HNH endonuclease